MGCALITAEDVQGKCVSTTQVSARSWIQIQNYEKLHTLVR